MIAALPMYDFAWVAPPPTGFWATIRDASARARHRGARGAVARAATSARSGATPRLLLGQTCGYPYWTTLRDKVEILATPIYGFDGLRGAEPLQFPHRAPRRSPATTLAEFRGDRAAVNGFDSNTGMNLFRASVAPLAEGKPFFADVVETGGHALSLAAVAEGRADIAAIDCVSYALLARGAAQLVAATKIIGRRRRRPPCPSSPAARCPSRRATRCAAALRELPPFPELGFVGVAFLPETAYARVAEIEREAVDAGLSPLA